MRLIDADAVLKGKNDHEMISTHVIWNAPTIDAEPIRHGKWVKQKNGFDECSVCNYHGSSAFKHCPNCGAKMDER